MAAFFWIHGGANANWNTVGNWSATSGGGSNAATPSVTSDVTFDGVGTHGNEASIVSAGQSVLSLTFTSGFTQSVTINTGVSLTIAGNFTDNTAHSWVVSGTGAMTISAASSINSGGKTFPGPVTFSGANTKTLVTNSWTITGTLTVASNTVLNFTTAETLTAAGLTASATLSGTSTFILSGGTWSGASVVSINLTFAGSSTVSGSVAYNTGTMTYASGTITTTSSTLTIAAATTLSTSGISWNNITYSGAGGSTLTINSLLTATGTLLLSNSSVIFGGTSGFTVGTFSCTQTGAGTITLLNNVTYTITTSFSAFTTRTGSILLFTSDHATNKAILILLNASTTCNVLASFTRIDAGGGRPIITFNGTITTCINVISQSNVLYKPPTSFDRAGRRYIVSNKNKAVIYQ